MTRHLRRSVGTCAVLAIAAAAGAQTTGTNTVTVPFSDPSRPGTVKVNVMTGSVTVKVGTGRDVVVTSTGNRADRGDRDRGGHRGGPAGDRTGDDPAAGLHRLTQPAGVNIEQENNIVTVSAPAMMGRTDVTLEVPAATSLEIHAVNGREVSVDGVNGSIEVNNVNGSIRLTGVGGPVIAHATNGRVVASLRQVAAGKPMAFTSFNGSVDVTLPASAKANLKLRSDRGDVYTDFDVQAGAARARPDGGASNRDNGATRPRDDREPRDRAKYRLDADRSIYGSINGGGPDFELRTFNGDIYLRRAK